MSKRFHDTNIWKEDWFIDLPKDYRSLFLYIKDDCDHAGVWKPNIAFFNKLNDCKIDLTEAYELFNNNCNGDGRRIIKLKNGHWFIPGFIPFQYGNKLNMANRVHYSVFNVLEKEGVNLTSIRPQIEVTQGLKDKDKDKDKDKEGGVGETKPFKTFLAEIESQYRDGTITLKEKNKKIKGYRHGSA